MGARLSTLGNALQSGLIEAECPLSSYLIPTCQIRLTGQSLILPQRDLYYIRVPFADRGTETRCLHNYYNFALVSYHARTFAGMYLYHDFPEG